MGRKWSTYLISVDLANNRIWLNDIVPEGMLDRLWGKSLVV